MIDLGTWGLGAISLQDVKSPSLPLSRSPRREAVTPSPDV